MKTLNEHLDEGILIRAVVDENDLTAHELEHLDGCPACSEKKAVLEGSLSRLGDLAADLAPLPDKRVFLTSEDAKVGSFTGWRPALAAVMSAVLVISALWLYRPDREGDLTFHPPSAKELALEEAENEMLMAEVMALEESVLPDTYIYIAGEGGDVDYDSFIDYVFPSENGAKGA